MRSKLNASPVVRLLLVGALIASPLQLAGAFDRSGARTLELQRDLRSVRSRVERAPRASSFDLENLQRRLHDQRIEQPRDPRLQELEIELRRLRAKAERAARRPIEKPRYLGGAHTPAGAQPARPYFGQRLVALQRNLAEIERRLELGDTTAAARLLEAAQNELATLRRAFDSGVAEDPNLIALEDQIRALNEQLAGR